MSREQLISLESGAARYEASSRAVRLLGGWPARSRETPSLRLAIVFETRRSPHSPCQFLPRGGKSGGSMRGEVNRKLVQVSPPPPREVLQSSNILFSVVDLTVFAPLFVPNRDDLRRCVFLEYFSNFVSLLYDGRGDRKERTENRIVSCGRAARIETSNLKYVFEKHLDGRTSKSIPLIAVLEFCPIEFLFLYAAQK